MHRKLSDLLLSHLKINGKLNVILPVIILACLGTKKQSPGDHRELRKMIDNSITEKDERAMYLQLVDPFSSDEINEELGRFADKSLAQLFGSITYGRERYRFELLEDIAESAGIAYEHYLSWVTMHIIGDLMKSNSVNSAFDPAFGLGGLFFPTIASSSGPETEIDFVNELDDEVEVSRFLVNKLRGYEINPLLAEFAEILGEIFTFDVNVECRDSLKVEESEPPTYDLVMCQSPVGQLLNPEYLKQVWPYGKPPKNSADWAWVQIAQRHINDEGIGCIFIPTSALFRPNPAEALIRSKMLRDNVIRAIVNFPSIMNSPSKTPISLLILSSHKSSTNRNQILLLKMPETSFDEARGSHFALHSFLSLLTDVFSDYRNFLKGKLQPNPGYSAIKFTDDVDFVINDSNLDPAQYVSSLSSGVTVSLDLNVPITQLLKTSGSLNDQLSATAKLLTNLEIDGNFFRLGELIDTGMIQLLPGTSRNDFKSKRDIHKPLPKSVYERGFSGFLEIPYVSVDDLRSKGKLKQTGIIETAIRDTKQDIVSSQQGDVVFVKTGTPAAKVDEIGGKNIFSPLSILRLTEGYWGDLSPELLAFVLNSENVRKYLRGNSVGRLQISLVPIPMLEPASAAIVNQALKQLVELENLTQELGTGLDSVLTHLNNALWGQDV